MVLGYCISGAANAYITFRSDWEKLSEIVIARQADEEDSSASDESVSDDAASSAQ